MPKPTIGTVTVVGMFVTETVSLQLGVYWTRALDIRFAGICPIHAWWKESMEAVRDGRIDPVIGLGIAAVSVREGTRSWHGDDCC